MTSSTPCTQCGKIDGHYVDCPRYTRQTWVAGHVPMTSRDIPVPAPTKKTAEITEADIKLAHRLRAEADLAAAVKQNALDQQVAGDHYRTLKIQPVEYIHANGISYFEGNVVKYVTRWRAKGGLEDLKKARHYLDLLIELETKK